MFKSPNINVSSSSSGCAWLPSYPEVVPVRTSSLTWSLLLAAEMQMNSRGGIKAEVRMMKVLETRLFEAQPAALQQRRRRGPGTPGVRSQPSVELLRFGHAVTQLWGEDALDAEV